MGKRFVVVGSATAVAGLVLGASIVFGPPSAKSDDPKLPGDIGAPSVGPAGSDGLPGATITGFDYTTFEIDSDGQLRGMRLRAQRTNLKPQGITQLIKPNAEIRLGSQRAITITADEADMEMEDSKPRSGQFTGNVVVTIAEAPAGTELILDRENPAHKQFIQQRIYLDEATDFSIEDDTINTQGPVHVTSAQVDFFGVGLRLAYNTQRERIEQLVINEGRYLIINPEADAPSFTTTSDAPNADAGRSEASGAQTPKPATPKQFYAATFQDNVLVRDGIESELAGQTLTIDFSLGTDAVQVKPLTPNTTGQLPHLIPIGQLAQASNITAEALPALAIPDKNKARTLLNHNPDRDTVVTWTGQLSVVPHATRPEKLTDEKDAHLTLAGPNAYAQTTRNGETERLESSKLQYLLSKEQTTAYASDDRQLRILSTALGGEITATKLIVRQQEGTATILGPGQLTYTNDQDGKTLNLTWQDRLDLELYTQANNTEAPPPTLSESASEASGIERSKATGPNRSQTKILGVKTATFAGTVTAKHTDFDLDADKLTLAFAKPDKQNDIDNTPTSINASGNVAVQARGDAEDETFDITAGRLTIDLKLDDDKEPYASNIRAIDNITVTRPDSTLTCNRVSVELTPPTNKPTNKENTPTLSNNEASGTETKQEDRYAQVRTILAVGKVRAKLTDDDRHIDLLADQLIANVEQDKLTLASDNANNPAEITDLATGRKLTGQLIEMDDQAQQLNITGKGSLATVLEDPNNPQAGIEDAFLAINWTKSMAFNNITGKAEFFENVRSESRRSIDASDMTCDHLTMQFSMQSPIDPAKPIDENNEDDLSERQIRSAVATGNVKFLASAWQIDDPKKIDNRIRLEGPKLVITNQPAPQVGQDAKETLVVHGVGRMVLEDYRQPDKKDADNKAKMTGRGATLFSWDQSMTLNALSNTATLVGTVQMVHLPKDDDGKTGNAVQLDCQKLVADLTDTGGMSAWLGKDKQAAEDKPTAQITSIVATETVRLLQQGTRSMRGDRLTYDGNKNLVTLNANDNRDVILQDLERDTATRTNKVTWDLATDRIEIDQLRGGVAPLN